MTGSFDVVAMLRLLVLKEFHLLMVNKYRFPLLPEAVIFIGLTPSPSTVAGGGDGVRATLRLVVLAGARLRFDLRANFVCPFHVSLMTELFDVDPGSDVGSRFHWLRVNR